MIEAISERVSSYLYRHNEKQDVSRAVMKFALIGILTNGIIVVLSLLIGWADGMFAGTLLSLLSMAALRFLAGGHHISPPMLCVVLSTLAVTLTPFVPDSPYIVYGGTIASLLIAGIFAPADLEKSTRISKRMLRWMKYASVLLVAVNFFVQSYIVATAFFIVSLTLISFKGVKRDE